MAWGSLRDHRWSALLVVLSLLTGAVGGYSLAHATNEILSMAAFDSRPPESATPSVTRVVDSPGLSDCHPLEKARTSLQAMGFGDVAAVPVVMDSNLQLWGPKCVISAGLVKPYGFGASTDAARWTRPQWDMMRVGPTRAELIDVPGISDCRRERGRQRLETAFVPSPFVAVLDLDDHWWGPSCLVSSGVAAS